MRLCMGCMSEVEEHQDICPYCGYRKDTAVEEAYYLLPETVLSNRYIVGKVLGYGGFGVTYIGWDGILKRIVAIKEYFPSDYATRGYGTKKLTIYSGDAYDQFQSGLSSFISEAKRQAQLHNVDGVVRIYDCVQENDTGYIIMEYLDGKTIKELLQDDGKRYSYEDAEEIIKKVLETLAEVHKTGIIHRDIAPDNIFITHTGEVKLIDFGAARYAASVKSRSLSVILKPGYAPEEQYRSHGVQGPWTDVYGTGATFYRMITGIKPDEAIERMVDDQLLPPSELGATISPEKEKVLMKSLSVRKEGRYQTADEFLSALTSTGREEKAGEKKEKKNLVPLMIGAACIAVIGAGSVWFMRNQKKTEYDVAVQTESESDTLFLTEKQSETETERPTEKQTETETEKLTEKQTETEKPTEKQTETETEKPTEKPTETETEKPTEKQTEAPKSWNGMLMTKTDGIEEPLNIETDGALSFSQFEIFTCDGTEETSVYKADIASMYEGTVQPELEIGMDYDIRMTDENGNQVYGYYNISLADYRDLEIHQDNGYLYVSGMGRDAKAIDEKQYKIKADMSESIRYSLSSLNIRRKPDTEAGEKISRYAPGDEITVCGMAKGLVNGEESDWYLVKCDQGYGFISAKDSYTTDSKEEADAAVEEARRAAEAAAAAAAAQAYSGGYSGGGSSGGGSSKGKSSGGGGVVWDNGGVQWD